jgi:TonB family protein
MAATSKIREADLKTASAEERARTFDAAHSTRPPVAPGPAPGDVLKNRFVLHQRLAEGSTSRLFRALDRRREAAGDAFPWVALKVVTAAAAEDPPGGEPLALRALRREAAIAQGLEHPNLPRIIGIDHDGPHTFLCMAWLEGESLAAILDGRGARPMTRVQALHILDGVARALTHLHALGITHADVKPGNILVTAQGDATLLDFGVALGPGAADLPHANGHTPEYASPQVLAGNEATPSDDLFSLACVAYRMLGGDRAFGTASAAEAEAAGQRPAPLLHLSPTQWRELDRALSFSREGRQADVASFMSQLKGTREERAAATLPDSVLTSTPAGRQPLRHPGLLVALVVVVAVALVASGLGLLMKRVDAPPAPPGTAPTTDVAPATPVAPVVAGPTPEPSAATPPIPQPGPAALRPLPPDSRAAARPAGAPARRNPDGQSFARPTKTAGLSPVELAGPPVPEAATLPVAATPGITPGTGGATADTAPATGNVAFSSLTVRHYVEPDYPRSASARRLAGWVDVAFTVKQSGKTEDVRVVSAEPPGVFDDAALAAVRRWRFADAGVGTAPIRSQIRVRFDPR